MTVEWEKLSNHLIAQVLTSLVFLVVGLIFFGLADWFIARFLNASVRRGIEEEKNVALAIVIGSIIIGLALIISAAIHG
jgi:uncharacterized membrane protein YjfL (UPF0719 family)